MLDSTYVAFGCIRPRGVDATASRPAHLDARAPDRYVSVPHRRDLRDCPRDRRAQLNVARHRVELAPQQSGSATPVMAVISPVTPIVLAVIASVAPVIAAVIPPLVTPTEQAGPIASVSGQSHLHALFIETWRSASAAAISAWVGIRPLPSS